MNDTSVTLGEACQRLGIVRSTLTKRLKLLGIKPRHNRRDKRESYITLADIDKIQAEYQHNNDAIVSRQYRNNTVSLSRQELAAKVEALEAQVAQLKQGRATAYNALQSDSGSASGTRIDYYPRPERAPRISTSGDTMPEGWMPLYTLCDQHDIPSTNVSRAIRKGILPQPHKGEWVYHGTSARNGLDEAMQAAILAWHAAKKRG